MKKIFFIISVLVLVSATTGFAAEKTRNAVEIGLPHGIYKIANEKDYQKAKWDCKNFINKNKRRTSDYCMNELRWQRDFGSLKFLGEEKKRPIFSDAFVVE